jgi:hypothetical protein
MPVVVGLFLIITGIGAIAKGIDLISNRKCARCKTVMVWSSVLAKLVCPWCR